MTADRERSGDLTLREARREHFATHGLGADGGYADRWVRFKVGPLPIAFPNTAGRRRAVVFHDLHHVLTGYDTDLTGEAEISAWEIASGCGGYRAAWLLDLYGLAWGVFLAPRRVWRAFVSGRRSRNLYPGAVDDALLERTVGDVRAELGLIRSTEPPTFAEGAAFAWWLAVAWVWSLVTLAPLLILL